MRECELYVRARERVGLQASPWVVGWVTRLSSYCARFDVKRLYSVLFAVAALGPSQLLAQQETEPAEVVNDCGPQCLLYLSRQFAVEPSISLEKAYDLCGFEDGDSGINMRTLKYALESVGLCGVGFRSRPKHVKDVRFEGSSFVVVVPQTHLDEAEEQDSTPKNHLFVLTRGRTEWFFVDPTVRTASVVPESFFSRSDRFVFLAVSPCPRRSADPAKSDVSGQGTCYLLVVMTLLFGSYILVRGLTRLRQTGQSPSPSHRV